MNRKRYIRTILSIILLLSFLVPSFAAAQEKKLSAAMQSKIDRIKEEVRHNGHDFAVGYNPAMEYSLDQLCGLIIPYDVPEKDPKHELKAMTALPAALDWRTKNGVTPIKNQGGCGSCWAFSAVGVFESAIRINTGQVVDLSEQNLVNCNTRGYGCDGGTFDINDYHVNPGGTMESCSPYTAREGNCNWSCAKPYRLERWAYVNGTSPSVEQIKTAIATYGPVSAGVSADSSFQAYRSGIFRGSSSSINHAILLVGWNDNNGDGYFILKNSWGTGWGEQGYMRIAYGAAGVGKYSNYVVFKGGNPVTSEIITLKSMANGKYVCAENAGANPLIANRTVADTWEKFEKIDLGNGTFAFKSLANGKFVCAESAGNSPLIANRTVAQAWESFWIQNMGAGKIALKAVANNKYVCADNAGNSSLIANRTTVLGWETFEMAVVPGN